MCLGFFYYVFRLTDDYETNMIPCTIFFKLRKKKKLIKVKWIRIISTSLCQTSQKNKKKTFLFGVWSNSFSHFLFMTLLHLFINQILCRLPETTCIYFLYMQQRWHVSCFGHLSQTVRTEEHNIIWWWWWARLVRKPRSCPLASFRERVLKTSQHYTQITHEAESDTVFWLNILKFRKFEKRKRDLVFLHQDHIYHIARWHLTRI